jgi:hypothetical protein
MTMQVATNSGDFLEFALGSVSSSNAGGSRVTVGETTPAKWVSRNA